MNALVAGERYDFRPRSGLDPHEAWRPLDVAVARWVLAHGGSPLLARVAAWASLADGQGDAALWIGEHEEMHEGMPPLDEAARAALVDEVAGSAFAADGTAVTAPFVVDGDAFYLRRNFIQEVAVAAALRARREAAPETVPLSDVHLRELFNGGWRDEEAAQRAAVRQSLGKRVFVLTGGPGTGKTTTVLRMLLALAQAHASAHAGQAPAISLAAPTGKAAQRLADALRDGGRHLVERPDPAAADWQPLPDAWSPTLANVLAAESTTLHRLLGSRGRQGGYAHHAGQPLPADIVVVDEASMVDLALLRSLLDALRDDAVLVLVGDADQLTSVGTGSVLMDIVRALEPGDGEHLVRLRHCFRADTRLVPINEAVRRGDAPAFDTAWEQAAADGVAARHAIADRAALHARLRDWARDLHGALDAAGAFVAIDAADAEAIRRCLGVLRERQLLCALRDGEFGAREANRSLEARLRTHAGLADHADADWYPGRAVMVTRNDAATGLFNGDVGLCLLLRDDDAPPRLQVVFAGVADPATGAPTLRRFDPDTLFASEGAFALTVHKSQGSEYRRVAVLLPPEGEHPLLSRQLLYTALSRARTDVALWATDAAVSACLARRLQRVGRLAERIGPTQAR